MNYDKVVMTLNKSTANFTRVVGYCHHHHVYLTCTQYRGRQCLAKNCSHFEKNEEHPLWRHREKIKANKKARKI